jgi:GT2 family glycosyltransferase
MLNQPRPKVSIVSLNLNGYRDTRDCLESLQQVQYPNFDVIVVDNGSSDDSSARLQEEFPEAKLLRSQENLGFSGGNNLGIEHALDNGADYVLLLNNDTVVDPNFLSYLVQVGESEPRIGILGPKIFYLSEPQRIWYAGGYVKYGNGVCGHLGIDQLDQEGQFSRVEDTEFITGCAMIIKSSVFREIGLLDSKFFFTGRTRIFACARGMQDVASSSCPWRWFGIRCLGPAEPILPSGFTLPLGTNWPGSRNMYLFRTNPSRSLGHS